MRGIRGFVLLVGATAVAAAATGVATASTPSSPTNPKERSGKSPRIAIIGGGIGGSASAQFLRSQVGPDAVIELFEKEDHLCGRLGLLQMSDGKDYDTGGQIIHPRNMHMANLTKIAGLTKDDGSDEEDTNTYFYDLVAKKFNFKTTGNDFVDTILMLWNYGLSPIYLNWEVDAMLKDFDNIYDLQASGKSYNTVEDLIHAMGGENFVEMLSTPLPEYLSKKGIGEALVKDFAGAAMACNYGQRVEDMHAFVGMVSLAGIQPGLWSIKEGNGRICPKLLDIAKATVHLSTPVKSITKKEDSECDGAIQYTLETAKGTSATFDAVIVAAPLQLANIQFIGFKDTGSPTPGGEGEYHRTVATFVQATQVDPRYFTNGDNFDPKSPPDVLATTPSDYFTSVGLQSPNHPGGSSKVDENYYSDSKCYKVFSNVPLEKDNVMKLFGGDESVKEVKPVDWRAYPEYNGFEKRAFSHFNLDPETGGAVAYTSPIEWAASAMEMSCIGANNAANLIASRLKGKNSGKSKECPMQ